MSEREYRKLLAALCADLDRRARRIGRGVKGVVLPAALGTALALGAGACGESVNDYGAPPPSDARRDVVPRPDGAYGVPDWFGHDQATPDAGVDTAPSDATPTDAHLDAKD